jgi:hypothetical protein
MQNVLLALAGFFVLVKVVCTIWYVRQPDATAVTATPRGSILYYAGKFSPALVMACMLVRACIPGPPLQITFIQSDRWRVVFWAAFLVIATVAAIVAVRQHASGTSYGLVHDAKLARRRGHGR